MTENGGNPVGAAGFEPANLLGVNDQASRQSKAIENAPESVLPTSPRFVPFLDTPLGTDGTTELGPEMFASWATGAVHTAAQPVRHRADGFVYFIGGGVGCIKIGWAKNPAKRLKALQTGSPIPLYLLAVVAGPCALEREYHQRFKAHWSHGEWFARHFELNDHINELAAASNRDRVKRGLKTAP
jgi:hypothetical protein